MRDDHDDNKCRDEGQHELDYVIACVAPEGVLAEAHRLQEIEYERARLDLPAHVPDDEHFEEVEERRREDQVDHGV